MTTRPSRRSWLLGIADAIGAAADCTRRRCGAVIYDPTTFHLLSTGYNGLPAGEPGCLSAGACPRGRSAVSPLSSYLTGDGRCQAVHAEDNALRRARERGIDVTGMHVAVSGEPCEGCRVLLRHYGVALAVWPDGEAAP